MNLEVLDEIINKPELREIARKAVEDVLVEWRDERLSLLGRGNGMVIKESDGKDSDIIRMGAEQVIRIGIEAIARHLRKGNAN